MKIPFFYPSVTKDDKEAVMEVLGSQWLTGGQKTVEFEKRFAEYIGVKHAISVNSCTAALHLAMRALNIGVGDEVIVPTLTFAATANATIFCGAKPVFADIDEKTLNISCESIEEKITEKTKAIIPVHIAGQPCDMDRIISTAMRHDLRLVEDCAHSLGATFRGYKTGCLSDVGCFSFYPTKPITSGEGGMLTTNSDFLADIMRLMRSHGMSREAWEREKSAIWKYDVVELGYNYRMPEMSAALGLSQLQRVEQMNGKRAKASEFYTRELGKVKGIITPKLGGSRTTSYHLYIIRVVEKDFGMSRDELFIKLAESGIECSVHYTPLHLMTCYQKRYGYKRGDFPIAEKVYDEIISLPIFPDMTYEQMDYVTRQIEGFAK